MSGQVCWWERARWTLCRMASSGLNSSEREFSGLTRRNTSHHNTSHCHWNIDLLNIYYHRFYWSKIYICLVDKIFRFEVWDDILIHIRWTFYATFNTFIDIYVLEVVDIVWNIYFKNNLISCIPLWLIFMLCYLYFQKNSEDVKVLVMNR